MWSWDCNTRLLLTRCKQPAPTNVLTPTVTICTCLLTLPARGHRHLVLSLVLQMCLTGDKCTFYKPLRLKPTHVQEHSCKTRNLLIAHQKKKKNYGRTNRSRDHCTEDPLRQVCSNIDSSLERGAISDPQPPGEMSVDCVRDYQLDDERDGAADTFASRTAAGRHVNNVRPGNTLTHPSDQLHVISCRYSGNGYFLRTNPIQTLPFTTSSCVICGFPPVASRERGESGECVKNRKQLWSLLNSRRTKEMQPCACTLAFCDSRTSGSLPVKPPGLWKERTSSRIYSADNWFSDGKKSSKIF